MRSLLCFFIVISFLSDLAEAVERKLTLYTEEYPPYNYLNNKAGADGQAQITGINYDIVMESCRRARITCEVKLITWTRAFNETLENPRAGIFSTSRTRSRQALFQWVGPLEKAPLNLYKLKSNKTIHGRSIRELSQYSVGVVRGAPTRDILLENYWDTPGNIVEFSSFEEFYRPFMAGRFDLLPGPKYSTTAAFRKYGFDFEKIEVVWQFADDAYDHNLALNHGVPGQWVKALQKAVDDIYASDWIAQKRNQYP